MKDLATSQDFLKTYLKLSDAEEQQFKEKVKEMDPKEGEKIMEVITSYERKGREEGREKGRKEGREEGIIQVAKRMLAKGKQVDEVADLTALSIIDVEKLKVEMTKD